MRERLLGSSGADLSRVYFMHECGSLHDVESAAVFHWDDLDGVSAEMVVREGSSRGAVDRVAVSFADLLTAWQLVQRLQADLGRTLGDVVQAVCPVCGSDDVSADDWEFDGSQSWQSVSCHDCGSYWSDVFALVARENVVRGNRVDVATARRSAPVVGPADHLDMAYEDANGCGVES
jgi:hypothetical protein